MEILNNLLVGFQSVLHADVLLYCLAGVVLGMFVGVLPGIGSLAAISLLLPITFHLEAMQAIVMLAGIYYGAEYGGSIASILLKLPGTTSSAVTCLDGYPMACQGKAGVALFMTTVASVSGAFFSIILLIFFSNAISDIGLRFGPPEYFSLIVLALIISSTAMSSSIVKGLAMVTLGVLLSTIGLDLHSGIARFDFGIVHLSNGINLVALALGFFAVSEIVDCATRDVQRITEKVTLKSMVPDQADIKKSKYPIIRGSIIGSFFGALPGTGAAIASFFAYSTEKRISSDPGKFGNGAIEGVVSPEAANNAAVQSSFIPTLTLGIPGTVTAALIVGALIVHGVQPGPMFIEEQPALFWGLIASFFIGNLMLLVLNIPLINLWVSLLKIPYRFLYPFIIICMVLGVYSINNNAFDILALSVVGVVGYLLVTLKFDPAPLLLGFILAPLIEENLIRSLLLSRGDLTVFLDRPISAGFLLTSAALLSWPLIKKLMKLCKLNKI